MPKIDKKYYKALVFIAIFILAAVLRLTGRDWDQGAHLHPDERYNTMVATAIGWPANFTEYMDPATSPLSPFNSDYKSYIYGTFPLFLTKYVAESYDMGGYDGLHLVGRSLSAIFDLGTLVLVFIAGSKVFSRRVGLYAMALYAVSVLAIQQSHFFTVDNFETFWVMATFTTLVYLIPEKRIVVSVLLSLLLGVTFGMAVASKVSAALIAVVIAAGFVMRIIKHSDSKIKLLKSTALIFALGMLFTVVAYATFRLAQPYVFTSSNWLDPFKSIALYQEFKQTNTNPDAVWTNPAINPDFQRALDFQRKAIAGEVMFPPQWQWVDTPAYIFPLRNLLLWGVGLPIGLAALAGIVYFVYDFARHFWHSKSKQINYRKLFTAAALLIVLWVLFTYLYRGGQFVKSMRYFLATIPFLAIMASYFVFELKKVNLRLFRFCLVAVFIFSLLWSVAFVQIYSSDTTRVAAARWIYDNIPAGSSIANEHWDDPLPIGVKGYGYVQYDNFQIEVYNPDELPKKFDELKTALERADYVILSSARASGSIGELSADYPIMDRYYSGLDSGALGFELAYEGTSYPTIFGQEINDKSAEEAFWVYDHPTVRIYQKKSVLTDSQFEQILSP